MKTSDRTSPNLEVISNHSERDSAAQLERRRLPRLCLTSELFRLSGENKVFSVTDLSETGMALWVIDRKDISLFSVGLLVEGQLSLRTLASNKEKFVVKARVRNLTADRIGFEFEALSQDARKAVSNFLNPALLGKELKPIPSSETNAIWYHGPSGTDLLLYRKIDGQFERFALYVLGNYVQWEREHGLMTGRVTVAQEQTEVRGIVRLQTLLLHPDPALDASKLSIAKTVIQSSSLPEDLKGWCTRHLER